MLLLLSAIMVRPRSKPRARRWVDMVNAGLMARPALLRSLRLVVGEASDNIGGPVARQDPGDMGLAAAFELLGLFGARLLLLERGLPDPAQRHRLAVGDKLQFVFLAVFGGRRAGDAGDLARRDDAELAAGAGRGFHQRHRQAIDL